MSQYHDLLHHWPAGAPPPRSFLLMYVCMYQRPYTDNQHTDTRRATAIVYHYASIIFVSGWGFLVATLSYNSYPCRWNAGCRAGSREVDIFRLIMPVWMQLLTSI